MEYDMERALINTLQQISYQLEQINVTLAAIAYPPERMAEMANLKGILPSSSLADAAALMNKAAEGREMRMSDQPEPPPAPGQPFRTRPEPDQST